MCIRDRYSEVSYAEEQCASGTEAYESAEGRSRVSLYAVFFVFLRYFLSVDDLAQGGVKWGYSL